MPFSEHALEEIRARLGIFDLVSEYVQLKKSGQGFTGLCPFHKEKTPSFHVHPQKQIFHCFGCQKGGNIFTFLCAIEGLKFPEAVRKLAEKTGVTVEEKKWERREPIIDTSFDGNIQSALEWAAKYFHFLLLESKEFSSVRKYLEKRGLSERSINKFQIGFSPKGWQTLIEKMEKRGYSFSTLVKAGLAIEKEGSPKKGYDRFRERIMFPIRNPDGKVVGFGARLFGESENQPKYINSPESPFFPKRKLLYGFFENQRGIRLQGSAILVEGYMDVVGLFDKGVDHAVATMGTALTVEHCQLLKKTTRNVVTVFDSDQAGQDAWHRSVHLFLSSGIFAKDLSLTDNLDPDEFIMKSGNEKFLQLCEEAPRQITKFLKEIALCGPLTDEKKSHYLSELTPILVATKRTPDRALIWDDISLVLGVSHESLKELATQGEPRPSAPKGPVVREKVSINKQAKPVPLDPIDFEFFKACLRNPGAFLASKAESWEAALKEAGVLSLLKKLHAVQDKNQLGELLVSLAQIEQDPKILGEISERLIQVAPPEDPTYFDALLQRLSQRKKEQEIQILSTQLHLTRKLGNPPEELKILERIRELRTQ